MSNANNNKGSVDTRRAGGRPKLARYEVATITIR